MALFQIPTLPIEQLPNLGQVSNLVPSQYLVPILAFSAVFFLLSLIRLKITWRLIAGVIVAAGLVTVNFVPAVASKITPYLSVIDNLTKSLGQSGTLFASVVLIALGFVYGKVIDIFLRLVLRRGGTPGKSLFKGIIKKAGEPTSGMEVKLRRLEQERDHLISKLKSSKGNPVAEMNVEKKINKVNEKINVMKAKLGMPLTA